jgi:hypothetical protein
MDSLARKKRRQALSIAGFAVLVLSLVALHTARPSPEEKARASLASALIERDGDQPADEASREKMREQWQRLSPESRRIVFEEVARDRLNRFRERHADLSDDDRRERILKAVEDMRENRRTMSDEEKAQARERLGSEEGREAVANVLNFFQNGMTARERAEYDPLIHEWVQGMQEMIEE